jgi:Flp pilus assembly protein CpaB
MVSATINKSATVIVLVVFLGLGVVELISHIEAAESARPMSQTEVEARSQVSPPEPATLVRSYETSLAPYSRMRGRWTLRLLKDEPVVTGKLAPKGSGRGMAALIPKGMRAFTIQTPSIASGGAGFVMPGHKVDVLLTMNDVGTNDQTVGGSTTTLVQNVEIRAVDQNIDAPAENKMDKDLRSVTLLVTPQQAKHLDLGQNKGTLHLAFRNESEEWAVFRDHDRTRVIKTTNSEKGVVVFESIRQGKLLVSVFADGKVLGWLQPSAQQDSNQLGGSLCSPCYGIVDQEWIPNFLRTANTSVEAETLEGHPLFRLRGLTMDAKIDVWIDPSLNYAARRIRFDKRASEADPGIRSGQFDATRFRLEKGHYVVTEATTTWTVGPQPIVSPLVVEKMVKGKRVKTYLPATDMNGNILMDQRRYTEKIMLRDIDFDPRWTDRDFQFSRPMTNGTRAEIQGAPDPNYVWKDGWVVLTAHDPTPK